MVNALLVLVLVLVLVVLPLPLPLATAAAESMKSSILSSGGGSVSSESGKKNSSGRSGVAAIVRVQAPLAASANRSFAARARGSAIETLHSTAWATCPWTLIDDDVTYSQCRWDGFGGALLLLLLVLTTSSYRLKHVF